MGLIVILLVVLVVTLTGNGGGPDRVREAPDQAPPDGDSRSKTNARSGCPLGRPDAPVEVAMPGCTVLLSDTARHPDPSALWGQLACEDGSRHQLREGGADSHPRANGSPQADDAYRRLTVIDGDDIEGERCEIGENDRDSGPTVLYPEGERRVTFLSLRLPSGFELQEARWQVVMQMKQTQPADNGGGTPVLALEAFDGSWRVRQSDSAGPADDAHELWSAPAETGDWTRFAFDVTYSDDPSKGRLKVYADLNGDSDFDDPDEQSPTIATYTLKLESNGDDGDGLSPGDPIPSHLRAGLYHDAAYACVPPRGCHVDLDNVQVLSP